MTGREVGFRLFAFLLVTTSCRGSQPADQWPLNTGKLLGSLATDRDTMAVLVWNPAECFVCRPTLHDWLEWGKSGVGRGASLVLTREPTQSERSLLISSRLTYSVWLAESPGDRPPPALFVFISGEMVDSATGDRPIAASLNRWRRSW